MPRLDPFSRRRIGDIAWGVTATALAAAVVMLPRRSGDLERDRQVRVRAEAEKLAGAKMHDLLMASTSHDLKTPLASIRLLTHLLKRDAEKGNVSPEHLLERVALIEVNVAKMSSLIGELLDVARLHGGGAIDLQLTETDLVALARKVVDGFGLTAAKHRILVEAAEPRISGMWDANRMERVLTNLVNNGLKYSPDGGDVTIRLACERDDGGDVAVLAVGDEGMGIPARDLPHIFEWFHRGSNVADFAGTGVGLASAKLIVEKHGGEILVASRQGRGTTVTLRLPVEAAARREDLELEDGYHPVGSVAVTNGVLGR